MKRLVLILIIVAGIQGAVTSSFATEGEISTVHFTLEPAVHPDSAGPVDMNFSFWIDDDICANRNWCDDIMVEVETTDGLIYHGQNPFVAHTDPSEHHSFATVLPITLSPNDTSCMRVILMFDQVEVRTLRYFVTKPDTVEFWKGPPRRDYWDWPKQEPDTNKYLIRIDLRSKQRYDYIMEHKDSIVTLEPTSDSGFYLIRVTRDDFNTLRMEGFNCKYLEQPPPREPGRPGVSHGTFRKVGSGADSSRKPKRSPSNDGLVWLDCVDGEDAWGRLPANQLIRFVIGFGRVTHQLAVGYE